MAKNAKPKTDAPAPDITDEKVQPVAEIVALFAAANSDLKQASDTTDRALVSKLFVLMSRKRNRYTVKQVEASIEAHRNAQGTDALQWAKTYARHIATVHAMMTAPDSKSFTVKQLFALAADLHALEITDDEGKKITGEAKTAAVVATVTTQAAKPADTMPEVVQPLPDGSEATRTLGQLEELRAKTPTRTKTRAPHHKDPKTPEPVAPEVALADATDALREAVARWWDHALANPNEAAEHVTGSAVEVVRAALADLDTLAETITEAMENGYRYEVSA